MLEAFLKSINCVIIMGLLAGAGYWTASKGWYDQTATQLIARLVTFLSLPCYLFASVSERLTHDELIALAGPMVIPFISMWLVFFTSRIIIRLGHVTTTHSGIFSSAYTASNNMFIGLPVSIALFGEEAVIPTLLYFFANTTFFWTMGNYLEAMDGVKSEHREAPKVLSLTTVKRVFSPPLCGFLLAIILLLLDLKFPEPVMAAAKYMGGITTVLPVPELFAKVYVIQAALPCITQIAVLARYHHADVEFATTSVASTTLLASIALPIWMIILTAIH